MMATMGAAKLTANSTGELTVEWWNGFERLVSEQ